MARVLENGEVQISARIPQELEDALRARAVRADRSFSAELRRAIRFYLATAAPDRLRRGER